MNNNLETDLLDFCRVKKIFDKGFGFLSSLYYPENVFFHFSKIKDEEKRKMLLTLKRGVISIYFTSKLLRGKRKVDKVWLGVGDVPDAFLCDFINRLILELNDGNINPFEIVDALRQLKEINKLSELNYAEIISSKKIKQNPSILDKLFDEEEKRKLQLNSDF